MTDRTRNRTRRKDGTLAPDGEPPDDDTAEPEDKPWQWKKGKSMNPGGVPKAVKMLRDLIGERTNDGVDLVNLAIRVANGTEPGMEAPAARMEALRILFDRYYGKPKLAVEVTPGVLPPAPPVDMRELLMALDARDRADLERILTNVERAKREGKIALPPAPPDDDQVH